MTRFYGVADKMQIIQPKKQISKAKLTIGSVKLNSICMLAPMAGITDTVFRQIVRMFSKDCLLASEMLSSEALKMSKKQNILDCNEIEYPLAFQISGHKPQLMAESAKKLQDMATIIDINMGCPAPKIVKNNDGAKLMTDLKLASQIICVIKKAVDIPVTVKCRLGWDCNSKNYLEFAKMAEESGADAIIVHGRTRSQMYSGIADWEAIGEVKNAVKIPVIGNGDIDSPEKARKCLEISKCDGIAIARGALGDPGLIYRIDNYLDTGVILPEPTVSERLDLALAHCKRECDYRGELHGVRFMRKFFSWYIKDIRDAAKYRHAMVRVNTLTEVEELIGLIPKY